MQPLLFKSPHSLEYIYTLVIIVSGFCVSNSNIYVDMNPSSLEDMVPIQLNWHSCDNSQKKVHCPIS